jgi:LPS sulfotransferase NodH
MSLVHDLLRAVPFHTVRSYAPREHLAFVIVFLPRTGSNLLASMLDSHPDIICHHELFNPTEIHRSLSYKHTSLSFGSVADRDRAPFAFVARAFAFADGKRAVGFKIAPGQNDAVLLSLLLNRRIRKILLERLNWIQAYTSAAIAERTEVWSVLKDRAGGERTGGSKVRVDVADLRRFVRKRRLFRLLTHGLLRLTFQRFLTLDYEDLADPAVARRILDFVGVRPDHPLETRTTKQNPTHLRDRIENYEEVRRALAGTGLAKLLDPGPPVQ